MIGRGKTYFDDRSCMENPHFLLCGHVNDSFCNNLLQITSLEEELVHHLQENGFDAVFFMNYTNVIYCRDARSFRILETGRNPVRGAGVRQGIGTNGRTSRLRRRDRKAQEQGPASHSAAEAGPGRYYFEHMDQAVAWASAARMLRSEEVRCAMVVTNVSSMSVNMTPEALELLQSLNRSSRMDRSIAIYIFHDLRDIVKNYSERNANAVWREFYRTILQPSLAPRTEDRDLSNRLIKLGPPGPAEIRNLLYHEMMTGVPRLKISPENIEGIALKLAKYAGYRDCRLDRLMLYLRDFVQLHPDLELTEDMIEIMLGEKVREDPLSRLEKMTGLEDVGEEYGKDTKKRGVALKPALRQWKNSMHFRVSRGREMPAEYSRLIPAPFTENNTGFSLNAVLEGNPGTGKTEIMDMMGELYYDLALLPTARTVSITAEELMRGGANAMHAAVLDAIGGVLKFDEAYQIYDRDHMLAQECINQLVTDVSTYRGELAVVMGGYEEGMETILSLNPGMYSRFPNLYYLPDYTPVEMCRIFRQMLAAKKAPAVEIGEDLEKELDNFFRNWVEAKGIEWGNARENETLVNEMIQSVMGRMSLENKQGEKVVLETKDIPANKRIYLVSRKQSVEEAIADIDRMIGLQGVKDHLHRLISDIIMKTIEPVPGNYLFTGPPGTGKTVTARKMVDLLYKLKLIRRRFIYETSAKDLLSAQRRKEAEDYRGGQNSQENAKANGNLSISEIVRLGKGGIIFVDEAHQLKDSEEGRVIIRELVPLIERPDVRSTTAFILAGYSNEMAELLETTDSGLKSRFPERNRINFDPYTASELTEILREMAEDAGQIIPEDSEYLKRSEGVLSEFLERNNDPDYGNARFIRDLYLPESIEARAARLERLHFTGEKMSYEEKCRIMDSLSEKEKKTLNGTDIPARFSNYASAIMPVLPEKRTIVIMTQELIGKDDLVKFIQLQRSAGKMKERFVDTQTVRTMHCTIAGPVGSGHHTAARALACLWKDLGRLRNDIPLFRGKGNFEAGYVGQTAGKTEDVIRTALGGTLVVMYPSSMLASDTRDRSFGPEALGAIESAMSTYADRLSVLFVDSREGMERFLAARPGIQSLLAAQFSFEDFSPEEMLKLFRRKTDRSMAFSPETEEILSDFMVNWVSERGGLGENVSTWGNGAEIDRLVEEIRAAWSGTKDHRVTKGKDGIDRRYIEASMFPERCAKYMKRTAAVSDAAMKELQALTGLTRVKKAVERIVRGKKWNTSGGSFPGNYCFLGNPGVGKTTVARLMGGILKAAGVLAQGHMIARTTKELCNQQANDPEAFTRLIRTAKYGILFIDEAHELLQTGIGMDILQRLLKYTEDQEFTKTTCVILAGYPEEMRRMLAGDSGLMSRFGTMDSILLFDDYTPEELIEIAKYQASRIEKFPEINAARSLTLTREYLEISLQIFREIVRRRNFGNARFVRNYLHDSVGELYRRLEEKYGEPGRVPGEEKYTLTGEDIPEEMRRLAGKKEETAEVEYPLLKLAEEEGFSQYNFDSRCDTLARSVVYIQILDEDDHVRGEATGFLVTGTGHILTCHHVAATSGKFRVRLRIPGMIGGAVRWFEAKAMDPAYQDCDMGMIRIENVTDMPHLSIAAPGEEVRLGENVVMIGYSMGTRPNSGNADTLLPSAFSGKVSSIQTRSNGVETCYLNMEGKSGNSGSPVFCAETGRVIGVFAGSVTERSGSLTEEINYFFPIRYFYERFVRNMQTGLQEPGH